MRRETSAKQQARSVVARDKGFNSLLAVSRSVRAPSERETASKEFSLFALSKQLACVLFRARFALVEQVSFQHESTDSHVLGRCPYGYRLHALARSQWPAN